MAAIVDSKAAQLEAARIAADLIPAFEDIDAVAPAGETERSPQTGRTCPEYGDIRNGPGRTARVRSLHFHFSAIRGLQPLAAYSCRIGD